MASNPAFDASSVGSGTGDLSWTHTPVTASQPDAVAIGVIVRDATAVNGATYGGVALTKAAASELEHSVDTLRCVWFYGIGGAWGSGAKTATVDLAAAHGGARGVAVTIMKGDSGETLEFDAATAAQDDGVATNVSASLACAANCILLDAVVHETSTALDTVGADQTSIRNTDEGTWASAASYEIWTASGTRTMSWTEAGSGTWVTSLLSIKETGGAAFVPLDDFGMNGIFGI
jgi:hypothetical protein